MNTQNSTITKLAETALMAALCYVSFTFLQIKIPVPVSYTHLDVYKRQSIRICKNNRRGRKSVTGAAEAGGGYCGCP